MKLEQKIKNVFPEALVNVPLAGFNNFHVGGSGAGALSVQRSDYLVSAVTLARRSKIPFVVIAGGSNVIFPNRLNKLLIIYRHDRARKGDFVVTSHQIECDASVSLNDLISKMIKSGLSGMESMMGIPGTVGGAVYGNAGAYGQWINESVDRVQILNEKGEVHWLKKGDCRFGLKDSIFKHQPLIILRVRFKFKKAGDQKVVARRAREILKIRNEKFKEIYDCCPGSFFKNISPASLPSKAKKLLKEARVVCGEIPSGYLIELAGGKGMRVGDIAVTDWHGNLLVNKGKGTVTDVKKLSAKLKALVRRRFGIVLQEEAQFIK